MANQLAMDKSLAINNLRDAGYSQRRIAKTLGVSRGAVRRHLAGESSNRTIAPTAPIALAPTGSADSNSTTAPTGSDQSQATDPAAVGNSQCEPFRGIVIEKCQAGLSARRIHQDLVADHGSSVSYWSVNRFVKALGANAELPFRRWNVPANARLPRRSESLTKRLQRSRLSAGHREFHSVSRELFLGARRSVSASRF